MVLWFGCFVGFGVFKCFWKGCFGSVSDYCFYYCDCLVVVVRFLDDKDGEIVMYWLFFRLRILSLYVFLSLFFKM